VIDVHGGEQGPDLAQWVPAAAVLDLAETAPGDLADLLQSHPSALLCDATGMTGQARSDAIAMVLTLVGEQRARTGRPHWLIIDGVEAVLHDPGIAPHALDLTKRGHCVILRGPTDVPSSLAATIDITLAGRLPTARGCPSDHAPGRLPDQSAVSLWCACSSIWAPGPVVERLAVALFQDDRAEFGVPTQDPQPSPSPTAALPAAT